MLLYEKFLSMIKKKKKNPANINWLVKNIWLLFELIYHTGSDFIVRLKLLSSQFCFEFQCQITTNLGLLGVGGYLSRQ